jgi:hypothetical protein
LPTFLSLRRNQGTDNGIPPPHIKGCAKGSQGRQIGNLIGLIVYAYQGQQSRQEVGIWTPRLERRLPMVTRLRRRIPRRARPRRPAYPPRRSGAVGGERRARRGVSPSDVALPRRKTSNSARPRPRSSPTARRQRPIPVAARGRGEGIRVARRAYSPDNITNNALRPAGNHLGKDRDFSPKKLTGWL